MRRNAAFFFFTAMAISVARGANGDAAAPAVLPGSEALTVREDLARLTNTLWQEHLLKEIAVKKEQRAVFWKRDTTSPGAYEISMRPNRERFRKIIGVIDRRVTPSRMDLVSTPDRPGPLAEAATYEAWPVRWPALEGVNGEGIMLRPKQAARAFVVLIPDADQTPEDAAGLSARSARIAPVAQHLANNGVVVIIPALVNRTSRYAGDERLGIDTNQSQREWIYRQAAEAGRHVIGYEVQRILSAIDWYRASGQSGRVGVVGYGEGGLLAFYAAALDPRIDAAWVSGYFQPREALWKEPVYRNVWGLLAEFGDAEIASLIAPRALIVEPSRGPEVATPAPVTAGPAYKRSAAPGALTNPIPDAIRDEWERALALTGPEMTKRFHFTDAGAEGRGSLGSEPALRAFWENLSSASFASDASPWQLVAKEPATAEEQRDYRTMRELQDHAQAMLRLSEYSREEFLWSKLKPGPPESWGSQVKPFREELQRKIIGKREGAGAALRPRTRVVPARSNSRWTAYEVALDVFPDAITWGYLLLPNDLKAGERRPVVVCQHGSGGLPTDTLEETVGIRANTIYQGFAAKLAARGFVVFAPYLINGVGGADYRLLQRKANPLGQSLFGLIASGHDALLRWLRQQPFVDPARIAFYGMSYGAKAAIRTTALQEGFCLTICSGDFGDNVTNMSTVRHDRNECMFYPDYELVEFNLANTFNYAEMAALIAPRPFMVEFGYNDRAVQLEGAAAEYAKVARLYFRLGIPERTAIEYFGGGHTVNGHKTFDFLHRFLRWPAPSITP